MEKSAFKQREEHKQSQRGFQDKSLGTIRTSNWVCVVVFKVPGFRTEGWESRRGNPIPESLSKSWNFIVKGLGILERLLYRS